MSKLLFFDIDGTIWDVHNTIPESTIAGIRRARENGHLAFLCSGRTRGYIRNQKLFDIGFDGVVSGCGTMIEYGGDILECQELPVDLLAHTLDVVRKYKLKPILEGREYLYFDDEDFATDEYGMKLIRELGNRRKTICDNRNLWRASKLSLDTGAGDRDSMYNELKEYYDIMIHSEKVCELVPKGYHKGTGIESVCRLLNRDVSDTFAFGDSVNDIGMLDTADVGIVMGNGTQAAKQHADYITTDMMNDGIWNALVHFKLI